MPTFANTIDNNEILAKRSQCDYAGNDIQTTYATKSEVTTGLASKQDTISDLATIRSGAADGATAVQPGDLSAVAISGNYSDLSNTPTIPSGAQLVPAATSADADKVLTVDAQGAPEWATAQAPISAGNGIDITNNVVSAKVDGTTITTNGSGELAVVNGGQSTASSFFTPAYGKSADGSLSTPRLGPSLHTRYYSFNSHGLALENSYVNSSISVLGRRPDVRLANFIQPNGNIIFMYGASTWNASWYPVWFPCNHRYDSAGYINVIDPTVYLKAKSPVTFTDQSTEGQYIYNSDGTYNTHFNTSNRYSFSVKAPLSTGYNVDTDTYDMIGDWTSITTPPLDEWVLTFWDGNNNTWKNIGGATEADSRLAVKWNTSSLDVKVMSGGGLDVNTGAGLYVTNPLPTSSSSDADKVLTVDSQGTPAWSTPAASGVTDVEVNGTSVVSGGVADITIPAQVNADWNAVSGAAEILNKPTIPSGVELVPAATSADADKVLTVDGQGVPGWAVVPAQSTGLFQAEYGTTSYADIVQAINDKKIVYCRLNSGASRMAFLAYIGSSNVEFQYYRSLSSHSASNMTDEVYVYTVSSSGWTTTTRKTGVKVVAGTHMSQSYSNDTLTLDCTWPTVDQTYDASSSNAQSGVAVASAIAGVNAVPASTSADADKVLTVDAQGTPAWASAQAPISAGDGIDITSNVVSAKVDGTTIDTNASGELTVIGGGGGTQADWTEDDPTAPSYIENKPVPKTLVAGTGITITETANNLTVASTNQLYNAGTGLKLSSATFSLDETVLFYNANGENLKNGITLSESRLNFNRLRITYAIANNAAPAYLEIPMMGVNTGAQFIAVLTAPFDNHAYDVAGYSLIWFTYFVNCTNTYLESATSQFVGKSGFIDGTTAGSWAQGVNNNVPIIYEVVGINRIAP